MQLCKSSPHIANTDNAEEYWITARRVTSYMAPGARSKFGAPMFKFGVFRKQMHWIEVLLVTLLGLFGAPTIICRPYSDSVPGELFPLHPRRYAPDYCAQRRTSTSHGTQL